MLVKREICDIFPVSAAPPFLVWTIALNNFLANGSHVMIGKTPADIALRGTLEVKGPGGLGGKELRRAERAKPCPAVG